MLRSMPLRIELFPAKEGDLALSVPVAQFPFVIGRGHESDLVVPDPMVSWQHALLQTDASRLLVRDLGSSNGTFLNGRRLFETAELADGDLLRVGPAVAFRVSVTILEEPTSDLIIEVLDAGLRIPIRPPAFLIGSSETASFRLDSGPEVAAALQCVPGGVILERDGSSEMLVGGDYFQVEGRRFKLSSSEHPYWHTSDSPTYPYRLSVTLDGERGHQATFEKLYDPGQTCDIPPGIRGDLLFLLSERLLKDRTSFKSLDEQGWCSRDEVFRGVWGRAGAAKGHRNRVNVLVHRLRRELTQTGFDPRCIEVRRGRIRLCLSEVAI